MKTLNDDDRVGTQNPIFCVLDAERCNQENKNNWTKVQQNAAHVFKERVYVAYGNRPSVFLNFRGSFVSVKVCAPKPAEKNSDAVIALNKWCSENSVSIVATQSGLTYKFQ